MIEVKIPDSQLYEAAKMQRDAAILREEKLTGAVIVLTSQVAALQAELATLKAKE